MYMYIYMYMNMYIYMYVCVCVCIYLYLYLSISIYIYNLHERGSSSNKETLYFRPDVFRLLPSSGVFALRLITYD